MTFLFLIYLLYHIFLKKSIKKLVFHQVEFNHNSCYIYLIGEFSVTRTLLNRHLIDIFIKLFRKVE